MRLSAIAIIGVLEMAEKRKKRITNVDIIKSLTRQEENMTFCVIEPSSGCNYMQQKFDSGNFSRHFRTQHAEAARKTGLSQIEHS